MFTGEEHVRIDSNLSTEEMEEAIEDSLGVLGEVEFSGRNSFQVRARRFDTTFANVSIDGQLSKARKGGTWTLTVTYQVQPSTLCWVIAIFGILFFFLGLLIFLAPNSTKSTVQRAVSRAVRDARDDIEEDGGENKD